MTDITDIHFTRSLAIQYNAVYERYNEIQEKKDKGMITNKIFCNTTNKVNGYIIYVLKIQTRIFFSYPTWWVLPILYIVGGSLYDTSY